MATRETADHPAACVAAPVVDADLCVHGLSPIAQCQACVTACPTSAFTLNEDGLGFDPGLCDGCGLCEPACPQAAIEVAGAAVPLVAPPVAPERAFAACERVVPAGEPGRVSCLHAISQRTIAGLYAEGIGTITVARADCASCPRNVAASLEYNLAALARLLADRALPPIELRAVERGQWRALREEAGGMSRRSLLRAAFSGSTSNRRETAAPTSPKAAPGAILPGRDRATLAAVVPHIDPLTCHACGACVKVCPHDAIRLRTGSAPGYQIDGTACTGCALCRDSCDVDALTLVTWQRSAPEPVPLAQGQCGVCGSPFYEVGGGARSGSGICRICATKTHRQKLFQVLP